MKLNLEIELDWINEEMNIDETIKQNIINTIVGKIQKNVESKVEGKINDIIDKTIITKINELTDKLFNDFINKEITITDNYGSALKCYASTTDLIKERFDNFMVQKVDSQGRTSTSNYDTKFDRITFIINNQLEKFAKEFTDNAVKKVSEEIRTHVHDGLTTKLGAELMKVLKVDKMLKAN